MDLSPLLPSPSPGIVNLLVVNPAGSRHLYGYNPDPGLLELRRVLDSSIRHPFDHGFVPNTRVASGGPLGHGDHFRTDVFRLPGPCSPDRSA